MVKKPRDNLGRSGRGHASLAPVPPARCCPAWAEKSSGRKAWGETNLLLPRGGARLHCCSLYLAPLLLTGRLDSSCCRTPLRNGSFACAPCCSPAKPLSASKGVPSPALCRPLAPLPFLSDLPSKRQCLACRFSILIISGGRQGALCTLGRCPSDGGPAAQDRDKDCQKDSVTLR